MPNSEIHWLTRLTTDALNMKAKLYRINSWSSARRNLIKSTTLTNSGDKHYIPTHFNTAVNVSSASQHSVLKCIGTDTVFITAVCAIFIKTQTNLRNVLGNLVPRVSHLTALALAPGGGKMRDSGNEVTSWEETLEGTLEDLSNSCHTADRSR